MFQNKIILGIIGLAVSSSAIIAQKKGVVIDELTQRPIPYVNIHISGTKIGFNSDEKGLFKISAESDDIMVFSVVGFENKELIYNTIKDTIKLTPVIYELEEVTISSKEDFEIEIGKLRMQLIGYYVGSFAPSPTMNAYYYPYHSKYEQTPYLKTIKFITYSRVNNAKFNVRLYSKGKDGAPGEMIYDKAIIGVAPKGVHKIEIDLDNLDIRFPRNGLFVAIQWLRLEKNKHEQTTKDGRRSFSIEPSFSAYKKDYPIEQWYYNGSWSKCKDINNIQIKMILNN